MFQHIRAEKENKMQSIKITTRMVISPTDLTDFGFLDKKNRLMPNAYLQF